MLTLISLLALTNAAHAYTPPPELAASPVLLVNYVSWAKDFERFNEAGSETRVFRDLVEILYDRDIGRPWGAAYFPEANRRLEQFHSIVCKALPAQPACFRPNFLLSDSDVTLLEKNLLDPAALSLLSSRWNLEIAPWQMPLREPRFSLFAGSLGESSSVHASFWNLQPASVSWRFVRSGPLGDVGNYRSGFEGEEVPALFTLQGEKNAAMNDWQLRTRSMDFAARWKHAISANRNWAPKNPIIDDKEIHFQRMFDEQAADFVKIYSDLKPKVSGDVLSRFEAERAAGDYPDEVYQQAAYAQLRELALMQGSYFSLAAEQRKGTSARQQALESLLTLQRYSASPRAFALEISTLMEPLTSSAFVLDEMGDAGLAQAYVLEQLKALLGLDLYTGKPLFPALGRGLLDPEVFAASYIEENAPAVKTALAGRVFSTLSSEEQIRILGIYLMPEQGKVSTMGLFRLAAAWLSAASVEELRTLADRVHEVRKNNFK